SAEPRHQNAEQARQVAGPDPARHAEGVVGAHPEAQRPKACKQQARPEVRPPGRLNLPLIGHLRGSTVAQSILAPEALTISAHLARSAFTVARNCSSVSLRTAVPMPMSLSRRA